MTLPTLHLVAGDGVRAEDHEVAVADLEPLVLARGHQGQRRHGLALRPGGDHAHLAGVEVVDLLDVDERVVGDVQQAHARGPGPRSCAIDRPRVATVRPVGDGRVDRSAGCGGCGWRSRRR